MINYTHTLLVRSFPLTRENDSGLTYFDCSQIAFKVSEKKFFKSDIYAVIHTSFDSVLDADSGDIFFLMEIVTNSEEKRKRRYKFGYFY